MKAAKQMMADRAATLRAIKGYFRVSNEQLMKASGYKSMTHVAYVLRAHPDHINRKALNRLESGMKEILAEEFPLTRKFEIVIELG